MLAHDSKHDEELNFYQQISLLDNALMIDLRNQTERYTLPSKMIALDIDDTLVDAAASISKGEIIYRDKVKIDQLFQSIKKHNESQGYLDHMLVITTARVLKDQIDPDVKSWHFTLYKILKSLGIEYFKVILITNNRDKYSSLQALHQLVFKTRDTTSNYKTVLVDNEEGHLQACRVKGFQVLQADPKDVGNTFWDKLAAFRFPLTTAVVNAATAAWDCLSKTQSGIWANLFCCKKVQEVKAQDENLRASYIAQFDNR